MNLNILLLLKLNMNSTLLIVLISFTLFSCNSNKDIKPINSEEQAIIDTLIGLGDKSYTAKNYEEALEYYEKITKKHPLYDIAYFKAGLAYLGISNSSKSYKSYSKAIDLNPNNPDYYLNRGIVSILDEKFKKAIKDFDKALVLKPNNKEALLKKASCYFYQDDYDESLKIIDLIIKQNIDFAETYYLRGFINLDLGKNEEAGNDFNMAKKLGYEVEPFLFDEASN